MSFEESSLCAVILTALTPFCGFAQAFLFLTACLGEFIERDATKLHFVSLNIRERTFRWIDFNSIPFIVLPPYGLGFRCYYKLWHSDCSKHCVASSSKKNVFALRPILPLSTPK